jgi:tetratricopeptide (TPR) repeat protein
VTRQPGRRHKQEVEAVRTAKNLKPWAVAVEVLEKASDLVVHRRYALAERVVRRAIGSAPVPEERAMLYCWLGHLAQIRKQQSGARTLYTMAERHDPKNYLAKLSLARLLLQRRRTTRRALLRARDALRFAPNVRERAAAAAVVALALLRLRRRGPATRALKVYGALWRRSGGQDLDAEVLKEFVAARVATEYCRQLSSLGVRWTVRQKRRVAPDLL